MARVVHFEINADDPKRAAKFYSKVFDWKIEKWDGPEEYWMVMTGPKEKPGIDGGLMKRQVPISGDSVIAYVCTIEVDSVDKYIKKIIANNGSVFMPKHEVMKVGWLAYCKDTEGNIFGIMEMTGTM